MAKSARRESLCWVHIGDLHITRENDQNFQDFKRIVAEINANLLGNVDFCVLPGDNADDGSSEQYALIRSVTQRLKLPLHVIPGDHDFKPRNLENFYAGLGARNLPYGASIGGHRCIFLDAVSHGDGGPDFHLGEAQLGWLAHELDAAGASGEPAVVFVHAYPADFPRDRGTFAKLLFAHRVRLVDMGHTHYNELANDGATVYATTRSTGQIEEGSVGFSLVTIQAGIVNWRFKPLSTTWPFVMLTSPGDHRLQTDNPRKTPAARRRVSARGWSSAPMVEGCFRVGDDSWQPMDGPDEVGAWEGWYDAPKGRHSLAVRVTDSRGVSAGDAIEVADSHDVATERAADGSDADSLDAWPDRHLLGTRLGPNRNGKQW